LEDSARILRAVNEYVDNNPGQLTPDMGGEMTTEELTLEIIKRL
jgi:isocitrate/isopropylmalate dehydrogenase